MKRIAIAVAAALVAGTAQAEPPAEVPADVEAVQWDRFTLHDSKDAKAEAKADDLDAFLSSFETEQPDQVTRFGPDAEPMERTTAPKRNVLDVKTPKRDAPKTEVGMTLGPFGTIGNARRRSPGLEPR